VAKPKKPWKPENLITSAIRKAWKNSPLRAEALRLACVNPEAKPYEKRYECVNCEDTFLGQQIEVNHKNDGFGKKETWDEFITRILCGVESITWIDTAAIVNGAMTPSLEEIVEANLQVLCKSCHSKVTKEQRAKAKPPKKGKAK
jgi:5-methylcytosine-specific restriction endonuclease McrA